MNTNRQVTINLHDKECDYFKIILAIAKQHLSDHRFPGGVGSPSVNYTMYDRVENMLEELEKFMGE